MPKSKIRRYGRKPGTRVDYPPEQDSRYKSLAVREEKAIALLNQWDRVVYHEPSSTGRELYYFASDRADECPYRGFDRCHVVTADQPLAPPPLPILPALPPEPPPNPTPPAPTRSTVFVSSFFTATAGLPPQILRAAGLPYEFPTNFPPPFTVPVPWLAGEQYATGVTVTSTNTAINLFRILAPATAAGQSLNDLVGGYWVTAGKQYYSGGSLIAIAVLYRYVPLPGEAIPTQYTPNPTWRSYRQPLTTVTPLVDDGATFSYPAVPLGVDPNNPNPPPPPVDPTPPPVPPSPDDPGRPVYSCTCQDFTRKQSARSDSLFESEWSDRDWSDSNAGAPVDDDGNAYCKHVITTMMFRGEW